MTQQQQHPITPPTELVQQWLEQADTFRFLVKQVHQYVAERAAQWGADQELEACCVAIKNLKWFVDPSDRIAELRAALAQSEPKGLTEEFNALCPQGYHAPGPASALSPAAVAVWGRFCSIVEDHGPPRLGLAAALLAAADQVVPENPCGDDCCITQCEQIRAELLAIATELRGQSQPSTEEPQ